MSKIAELEKKINQARLDYYNGQSKVSDKTFDAWIDELSELDPKNLAVIGIGAEPVSNWEKYAHKQVMGSLNKAQTDEEYSKWHNAYVDPKDQVFLTLKLDGLSVSLIYENGVLVKGVTRGSGTIGELITPNVARMQGVPLRLPQKINATIRGEILMSKENHTKHFAEYSNVRNAASGISRRFDGSGCDKLTVLAYQIVSDELDLTTQEEQFETLKDLGFSVPDYYLVSSIKDVCAMKAKYEAKLRDKYAFELDGLVAHNDSLEKQEQAGSTNARPKASIAIKFASVAKEANIADIQVQVGSMGRLTPVAIFNPKVSLAGAEIEKASLHNFANIRELGVDIGAKVLVCRSNDVIPYIEEVSESTGTIFEPPTECPICSAEVIESGEYIECPNKSGCPAHINGRIHNWVKDLNILELGDVVIEKLVEAGLVSNVADLYRLTVDDVAGLDRMGEKSAKNVIDSIWKCNEISLDILLGALSIPLIGSSTIRLIISSGFDTLEAIQQLTTAQLENINGIGPTRAKSLYDGLYYNRELIEALLDAGVKIKSKVKGKLTGKSFVFTGSMVNKRPVLEQMVIDAGGEVKGSVGKNLTYLVIADPNSTSSKAVKARSLGTTCISEEDFLELVK